MAIPNPTLLLETGDVACTPHDVGPHGMRLQIEGEVRVVGTVRLAFTWEGGDPGTVRMLAAVDSAGPHEDGTKVELRYLALHSTAGKPCLGSFLRDGLGLERPEKRAFKPGAGGWFYGFGATRPKTATRAPLRRQSGVIQHSERRAPRVAVRVPVVLLVDGQTYKAQAYNISSSGLYILLDHALPSVGTEVQIHYPVALHARPFTIQLVGEVMWEMPAMTSSRGGGLGVKIQQIDDGAGGEAWLEYVTREVEFGGAVGG